MSIPIKAARDSYGGATEAETLENMAKATGSRRIYKYANDFGDKKTHTDYKRIPYAGHPQETAMFNSPYVHNVLLVYEDGRGTQNN
jgi:hypothetical protein